MVYLLFKEHYVQDSGNNQHEKENHYKWIW